MTGEFEDVKLLNDFLMEKNKETGWETPIPVDAATGGFVAPFLYPNLEWDFKLSLVKTINFSGHNYGLVYAGVGWVVWRSKDDLPDEFLLSFSIDFVQLVDNQIINEEEADQFSPISILDYAQEHKETFSSFHQVLANMERRNAMLKQQIQEFEILIEVQDRCLANRNIELDDLESFRVEEKAIQLMDHVKTSSIEDCNPTTGNSILVVDELQNTIELELVLIVEKLQELRSIS
ncbi:hypothetical protein L1887_14427 [Cichorium endivia]|nr:hypothetical protein L1887_14427 [Cichorium endivia]